MKTLEHGSKRIQKIAEELKKEVIDPAKLEAEKIQAEAKEEARQIIAKAHQEAERIHEEMKRKNEQEGNVFKSSLSQAAKQTLEALRQEIEHKLFTEELNHLLTEQTARPKVIAKFIDTILQAIEKEGISANLSAVIPKAIDPQEINLLLGGNALKKLKEKSVVLGDFEGGAQIKIHDKKLTMDMSDEALMELLSNYRKDFRKVLFGKIS